MRGFNRSKPQFQNKSSSNRGEFTFTRLNRSRRKAQARQNVTHQGLREKNATTPHFFKWARPRRLLRPALPCLSVTKPTTKTLITKTVTMPPRTVACAATPPPSRAVFRVRPTSNLNVMKAHPIPMHVSPPPHHVAAVATHVTSIGASCRGPISPKLLRGMNECPRAHPVFMLRQPPLIEIKPSCCKANRSPWLLRRKADRPA